MSRPPILKTGRGSNVVAAQDVLTAEQLAATDITVRICPAFWACFLGTRAQLEAEGVVPKGTVWPAGTEEVRWQVGGLTFCLNRTRPDWMRGPKKRWVQGDHWGLYINVTSHDVQWRFWHNIEKKVKALFEEVDGQSAAGQRAERARWDRYMTSRNDPAFQAFKAKVLLQRKKPGPKPKAAKQSGATS